MRTLLIIILSISTWELALKLVWRYLTTLDDLRVPEGSTFAGDHVDGHDQHFNK